MSDRVRVPIRVRRSPDGSKQRVAEEQQVVEAEPAVTASSPVAAEEPVGVESRPPAPPAPQPRREKEPEPEEDVEEWRDRALRLQAEIENFRKRQRRLAEDRIEADRGRLLRGFLTIGDNLERALNADGDDAGGLRQGVEVTYRSLRQLLKQEGVEQIEAKGEPFDPVWHDAVGTIPHERVGAEPDTVVEVTQPGYRLDGRLLRPARVIVAT